MGKGEMAKIHKQTQTNTNSKDSVNSTRSMKSLDELEHQLNPLSVKEAARIYGECPHTFYQRIRRGEVPGVFRDPKKRRPRIRICPKEFVPWLKSQISHGNGNGNNNNNGNNNGEQEGNAA
jgi:hypothetical protein